MGGGLTSTLCTRCFFFSCNCLNALLSLIPLNVSYAGSFFNFLFVPPLYLHRTEQPGSVDPGQPLVNAIRTDSALIGGNSVHLSKEEQLIKEFIFILFLFFFKVQLKESDVVITAG